MTLDPESLVSECLVSHSQDAFDCMGPSLLPRACLVAASRGSSVMGAGRSSSDPGLSR